MGKEMTKKQVVCDGVLLTRLQSALPDEIDGLVDVITAFGEGRTGLDADLKKTLVMARFDPREGRYPSDLLRSLALELQYFGGHSIANATRRLLDKPSVSYSEIVDDVYKKLNGKAVKEKSLEQKERDIALALFGENWRTLSFAERYERSTSTKVLSGFFKMQKALAVDKQGRTVGLSMSASTALFAAASVGVRFNPFTAVVATVGAGVQSLSAEAYRITIPFVAQLGWVRLRQQAPVSNANSSTSSKGGSRSNLPVHNDSGVKLWDEAGKPLLSLSILEDKPELKGRKIPSSNISKLNPLLSNLPGMAGLAELSGGQYVLCSIPYGQLVDALGEEGGKRGWVTTGKKITEQARLSSPERLQNVLISGVAWNALSSAVGQKHLHDINEKLNVIKQQLDEVQEDLDNLRKDKLAGLLDYTQGVLDHFLSEGVNQQAMNRLEHNLATLSELGQYFENKMIAERSKVEQIEPSKMIGSSTVRDEILNSLARMQQWARGYVQVAQLRVVSNGLLYSEQPQERYRADAERVLDQLGKLDTVAAENRQIYRAQMAMSKSFLSDLSDDVTNRLHTKLEALDKSLRTGPSDTRQLHELLFSRADQNMLLYVKDGHIADAELFDLVAAES